MISEKTGREERAPNWLPLPGGLVAPEPVESHVDENDLFCKGEIEAYYPGQRRGILRNDRGQRLPFVLSDIALNGNPTRLKAGLRVGYDASRTSHGPRIVTLRIY